MKALVELAGALLEDLRGLGRPGRLPADSELRAAPSAERARVAWRWDVGLALSVLAFAAYFWFGWLIDQGRLNHLYNVAFDLDGPRFVLLFAGDTADWDAGTTATDYRVKHPFLLALRAPGLVLRALGLSPEMAVALMLAAAGAATVACAWAYLRLLAIGLAESAVLTVFFAGSCAQLFYATLIESYGFAALTLAFVHLAALMRARGLWGQARGRFLVALCAFGVTSTNVAMAGLAEIFVWARRVSPGRAVTRTLSYSAVLGALLLTLVLAVYPSAAPLVANPLDGLRQVKWVGVLEDRDLPKGGLGRELTTFTAFGFVAPELDEVRIEEDTKTMVDFRSARFSPLGWASLAGWLTLLAAGAFVHLRDAEGRHRLLLYAACLGFNLALHAVFQHRGSIFIVASHAHFPLFACAAGAAIASTRARPDVRRAVLVGLTALAALTLYANAARLRELLEIFA